MTRLLNNPQAVSNVPELQAILAETEPGDEMGLTILRDGEEMQVTVTLGE
jgi:S1-C subfamily serine protease